MHVITRSDLGGAQSVLINIVNSLCRENEVIVIAGEGDGKMWELLDKRIRRINVPALKRNISIINDIKVLFSFLSIYRRYEPDVIHLHSSKVGLLGRLAFPKGKVIYTVHGFDSIRLAYRPFLFLERMLQYRCKAIIGVCKYDMDNLIKEKITNNVGYIYREKQIINTAIYRAPFLMMKDGVLPNLKSVSAICYTDAIYNDSITAIVSKNEDNSYSVLRNIMGVLNSSLAAYLNLLTFSSSGIEREHTHDREKLSLPYIQDLNLAVEKIEAAMNGYHSSTMSNVCLEQQGVNLDEDINRLIYKEMNCSDLELCLIDYASSISIPMAIRLKGYEDVFSMIRLNDSLLKEYTQVYIDRFANSFNRNGKRFTVEILYSKQVIGMYFKVIDENMFIDDIVFTSDNKNLLPTIIALSSTKLTDALFVQKDVRGFEKEYFYIFKPNEKRLWHKAIAYLDVNEFDDAMLRARRNGK